MTFQNIIQGFSNLALVVCELVKWQPGIIIPFIVALIIAKLFHLGKKPRQLIEDIFGLLF